MTLKRNVVTGEIVDVPDPRQVEYEMAEDEARARVRRRLAAVGRRLRKGLRRTATQSRGR